MACPIGDNPVRILLVPGACLVMAGNLVSPIKGQINESPPGQFQRNPAAILTSKGDWASNARP